jgi:predicted metalloprotease with PDZ domain
MSAHVFAVLLLVACRKDGGDHEQAPPLLQESSSVTHDAGGRAALADADDRPSQSWLTPIPESMVHALVEELTSGRIELRAEPGGGWRVVKDTRWLSRAGVETGDVLLALDDASIDPSALAARLGALRASERVRIRLKHQDTVVEHELQVTSDKPMESPCGPSVADCSTQVDPGTLRDALAALVGVTSASPQSARVVAAVKDGQASGVKVYGFDSEANACWKIGLQNGDTVTAVDGHAVSDKKSFAAAIPKAGATALVFGLVRRGRPISLRVTTRR